MVWWKELFGHGIIFYYSIWADRFVLHKQQGVNQVSFRQTVLSACSLDMAFSELLNNDNRCPGAGSYAGKGCCSKYHEILCEGSSCEYWFLLILHSANNLTHSHHRFSFCSFMFSQNNGQRMFTNLVNLSVGNDMLLNRGIVTSHRQIKLWCFA